MEVSLRKPQRQIFTLFNANKGGYFRGYRKSASATRLYWRLMTKDHSPVANFPPGAMKPFFQRSLLVQVEEGHWAIKDDVVLAEKKSKKSK